MREDRRFAELLASTDTAAIARSLLGAALVRTLADGTRLSGRIVETEAYLGVQDRASHSYNARRTPRNEHMYAGPGTAYVYFTYGMHHCANIVTGQPGTASAVLMRAGEVVAGHELAAERRPGVRERDQARGPANLAMTLGLTRAHDGLSLVGARAGGRVEPPETPVDAATVRTGPRVGVSGAGGDGTAYPWRFWLDGEPTVSAYRVARTRNGRAG